jgi:acyl-[acyl-carrier-protein]-phospholipid O-acyltransferase/long-chain-fatty-acid--[acyl-carrier-protein] ligase
VPAPHHPPSKEPRNWRRGFWSLIATQFQTAFNDNALKFLVIYIIIGMDLAPALRDRLIPLVGALFALPFIFFSMAGGFLADRYSKRTATIATKLLEFAVMGFAVVALYLHNLPMECASVFLISSEAALFGPSKYGLLPELLPEKRLSWGNGIIELGTFVASIAGTMGAGYLAVRYHGREAIAGFLLASFTCFGFVSSFGISRVPAADSTKKFRGNPLGDFAVQLKTIRADRVLGWAILGNSYLFFLAALLQFTIILYGHDVLRVDDTHISYLQAAVGIGIGLGSFAAGYLSGGKIEYGLIPLGAIGLTVFSALLYHPGQTVLSSLIHLLLLGFFGGFFVVPVGALIQHRPAPEHKGGVIAAANLLSFVGIFFAAGAYWLFSSGLHQTPAGIFLDGAILTLVATAYSIYLLPDSLLRLVLWMLTHSLYRIRVEGRDNIPETGGALFVSNHMSLVDAVLLIASTDRPIRFLMFKGIYDLPYIKPFAKMIRAIPISSELRPREMLQSLREATNAIRSGEVVCIFAEGQITRIGQLLPFRRGMERIMKGVDAPIVPVNLDGVWGSIFSFERGRFLWKLPRSIPYPVTVSFGKPMPPTSKPVEVRHAVQNLHTEAYRHHKGRLRTLHRSLINTAHRHPFRFAMGDERRPRMKWGGALLASILLARRLRATWDGQEMVGILLPPSVPGALVNFAATLAGKIPVNLNYTSSNETLASCAAQCKLETVITTKLLLEKIPLQVPGKTIFLEEVAASPRLGEKILALVLWFLPGGLLERVLSDGKSRTLDDLATVIFSSGSTGEPKGVMLTHYNIGSNIEQVGQTFMLDRKDTLLGVLPLFRLYGHAVAARGARRRRRIPPKPPRSRGRQRTRSRLSRHVPARDAHVLTSIHAALLAGRLRQPAIRGRRRRKTSGASRGRLRGPLRHPPARRLWRYRVFARGRRQHARFSRAWISAGRREARAHRPSASGHQRSHRRSRHGRTDTHRYFGAAARAGPQRDERLPGQARKDRRGSAGRLVRHRRHRRGRRGRIPDHHRPPEPLQQNRRRDGASHQGRGKAARTRRRHGAEICRHERARRKKGRAARRVAHAHARRTQSHHRQTGRVRTAEPLDAARQPILPRRRASPPRHRQTRPPPHPRSGHPVLAIRIARAAQIAFQPRRATIQHNFSAIRTFMLA